MKLNLIIALFISLTLSALADGPIINVSPFMKPVLEAQSSADAQTKLGFTGTTTTTVISNTATISLQHQLETLTNLLTLTISNSIEYNDFPGLQWGFDADNFTGLTNGATVPTSWPDITGNYSVTETIGSGATFAAGALNGNSAVHFAGSQVFSLASLPPISALTNYTIVIVAQDTLEDGANRNVLEFSGGNTGLNANFYVNTFQAQNGGSTANNAAGGTWSVGITNSQVALPQTMGGHTPGILIVTFRIASANHIHMHAWFNGKSVRDTTVTEGGLGGQNIPIVGGSGITNNLYLGGGPNTGQNLWTGNLFLALGFTAGWTDDQAKSMNNLLEQRFGKKGPDITIVGASNANGAGSIMNSNFVELIHQNLPGYNINGMGVGGLGTGAGYTNYLSSADDNVRDGNPHLVVIMPDMFFNDVEWLSGSVTMNQTEANVTNLAYQAHLRGCLVIVPTSPSAFIIDTNTAASRATYNAFVNANWKSIADAPCDFSSDILVGTNGSYSNAVVYTAQDGVHIGMPGLQSMVQNELVQSIQYAIQGQGKMTISNLTTLAQTAGTINFKSNNLADIIAVNGRSVFAVDTNTSNGGNMKDLFIGAGNVPNFATIPPGANNNIGIGWNVFGLAASSTPPAGNNNIAIGQSAMSSGNLTGSGNTGIGFGDGALLTTGNHNTAGGFAALDVIQVDNDNTAWGYDALHGSSGGTNTALGAFAGFNLVAGQYNIYIANPGNATESQVIRIGTAASGATGQTNCYVPMPVTASAFASTWIIFGTNTLFNFGAGGVTNNTGLNMAIEDLRFNAGTFLTNTLTGQGINLITVSTTLYGNIILQPGCAIVGTGVSEEGDHNL